MPGNLEYLTIKGYEDCKFQQEAGTYQVLINPEKYAENRTVEYSRQQAQGEPGTSVRYTKSPPAQISFELIFDATGVVDPKRTDLAKEIKQFKDLAYEYNGNIHSTNYLKLNWGNNLTFQCRLESLNLEYTLFAPSGKPLRATAKVSFIEYQSPKQIQNKAQNSSPDMTHLITVVAGDTLPALCHRVYGTAAFFTHVALFNKLFNYRNLTPGTTLQFPPLLNV